MTEPAAAANRDLAAVHAALAAAGVRPLLLSETAGAAPGSGETRVLELLAPRGGWRAARRALDGTAWRLRAGADDRWRWPRVVYAWETGLVVHLLRGVQAGPLPTVALR